MPVHVVTNVLVCHMYVQPLGHVDPHATPLAILTHHIFYFLIAWFASILSLISCKFQGWAVDPYLLMTRWAFFHFMFISFFPILIM